MARLVVAPPGAVDAQLCGEAPGAAVAESTAALTSDTDAYYGAAAVGNGNRMARIDRAIFFQMLEIA